MGVFITCGGGSYTSRKFLNVYPEIEPCVSHGVITLTIPRQSNQTMNIRYSTEEFCSICHDSYEESSGHDAVRLNCQHAFGRKCIIRWALVSNICPVCGLETIPADFRRLAERTIFGPTREQKSGLLGLSVALYGGLLTASHHTINPDFAISKYVGRLLLLAAGLAVCGAYLGDRAPTFRSFLQGAVFGIGLSALLIWIATTLVQIS